MWSVFLYFLLFLLHFRFRRIFFPELECGLKLFFCFRFFVSHERTVGVAGAGVERFAATARFFEDHVAGLVASVGGFQTCGTFKTGFFPDARNAFACWVVGAAEEKSKAATADLHRFAAGRTAFIFC